MNPDIQARFSCYPKDALRQLERVRNLILKVAADNELGDVEETLKWGEASFLVKVLQSESIGSRKIQIRSKYFSIVKRAWLKPSKEYIATNLSMRAIEQS